MRERLSTPGWGKLRAVGNLRFLKVSYALLAFIPILTTQNALTAFLGFEQWLLAVTFFASLALAVANVMYDVGCPTLVKRFASPNDLYERMLQIADLSHRLYADDAFDASLQHCKNAYERASSGNKVARFACWWCYLIAVTLFIVLFGNRAYVVTQGVL